MTDLDKPLDQLVKQQRKFRPQRKSDSGRGSRRENGAVRGGNRTGPIRPQRGNRRVQPYNDKPPRRNLDDKWTHDLYEQNVGGRAFNTSNSFNREQTAPRIQYGSKIKITNLNYNVDENDLQELFGTVGKVVSVRIKYDASGRSDGEAYVAFEGVDDAEAAKQRYDGKAIDGEPMSIEVLPVRARPTQGNRGNRGSFDRSFNKTNRSRERERERDDPTSVKIRVTL